MSVSVHFSRSSHACASQSLSASPWLSRQCFRKAEQQQSSATSPRSGIGKPHSQSGVPQRMTISLPIFTAGTYKPPGCGWRDFCKCPQLRTLTSAPIGPNFHHVAVKLLAETSHYKVLTTGLLCRFMMLDYVRYIV
jgi:hypothetical protein